jgi:hypothetical protein
MSLLKNQPPNAPDESYNTKFNMNFKCPKTFSEKDYFKTVFLSGDDLIKQNQMDK